MMATTEAGGGVPSMEERVGRAAYSASNWGNAGDIFNPAFFEDIGRDFLEELKAAGLELVPVERMDRLLQLESMGRRELMAAWDESDDPGRPEGV